MPEDRDVQVHLLPCQAPPGRLAGGLAVVIDVLRATTTIVYALAAGARCVRPCAEVEDLGTCRVAADEPGSYLRDLVIGEEFRRFAGCPDISRVLGAVLVREPIKLGFFHASIARVAAPAVSSSDHKPLAHGCHVGHF